MPAGALAVSPDGKEATLKLERLAVIDQPRWPAVDADARVATMTVSVKWTATDERVEWDDPSKHFWFQGWRAHSQAECHVEVPSLGFTWRSDPSASSHANYGVIGEEANGRYYDQR